MELWTSRFHYSLWKAQQSQTYKNFKIYFCFYTYCSNFYFYCRETADRVISHFYYISVSKNLTVLRIELFSSDDLSIKITWIWHVVHICKETVHIGTNAFEELGLKAQVKYLFETCTTCWIYVKCRHGLKNLSLRIAMGFLRLYTTRCTQIRRNVSEGLCAAFFFINNKSKYKETIII